MDYEVGFLVKVYGNCYFWGSCFLFVVVIVLGL